METAYVILNSEMGFENDLLEVLKDIPRVKETFILQGVYDIILKVEADTMDELKALINKIRKEEKVRSLLSMIVINSLANRA